MVIYGTAGACVFFAFMLVGVGIALYLLFGKKDDKPTSEKH